jgi:YfiH family protein
MPDPHVPELMSATNDGVTVLTDAGLRESHGIVVAFTQRIGGRSRPPYGTLNMASHVGDNAACVDDNRSTLLESLGIEPLRSRLTMAEQVHGLVVREVAGASVGMGAYARASEAPPLPGTDALITVEHDVPLMLCFADCVPVVLVAVAPVRGVAVVHAGWRGALGRLPGSAAGRLAHLAGCETSDLFAYVGPRIGPCHYPVSDDLISRFVSQFPNSAGTIAAAQDRLDLGAVVSATLSEVGVPGGHLFVTDVCTAESTEKYFSYRAEGVTGRHGALAAILGWGR